MNDQHPSIGEPLYAPPRESGSGCIWGLAGCGVLILVFAGVIAGVTWVGMTKGKKMLVEAVVDVASQGLDETELP
ncbi:MAG: hypothetical protein AAF497_29335, partial [Planctomycetota bacterium]